MVSGHEFASMQQYDFNASSAKRALQHPSPLRLLAPLFAVRHFKEQQRNTCVASPLGVNTDATHRVSPL